MAKKKEVWQKKGRIIMIDGHHASWVAGGNKTLLQRTAKVHQKFYPACKYRIVKLHDVKDQQRLKEVPDFKHGYYGFYTINDCYTQYPKKKAKSRYPKKVKPSTKRKHNKFDITGGLHLF